MFKLLNTGLVKNYFKLTIKYFFTILVVYLIAKELFNEKIAIVSAFLLSISAYHISYALIEMDETMIFLTLLAFWFFIKEQIEKVYTCYGKIAYSLS